MSKLYKKDQAATPIDIPSGDEMRVQIPRADLLAATKLLPSCTAMKGAGGSPYSTHYLVRATSGSPESEVNILSFHGRQFASVPLPTSTPVAYGTSFTFAGRGLVPWLRQTESDAIVIRYNGDGQVEVSDGQNSHLRVSVDPEKYPNWDQAIIGADQVASLSADRLLAALDLARKFVSRDRKGRRELRLVQVRDGVLWAIDGVAVTMTAIRGLEDASFRLHGRDIPAVLRFLRVAVGEQVDVLETDRFFALRRGDGALFGVNYPQAEMPVISDSFPEAEHWWEVDRADLQQALRGLTAAAGKGDDCVRIAPPLKGPTRFAIKSVAGKWVTSDVTCLDGGAVERAKPLPVRGRLVPRAHLVAAIRRWKGDRVRFAVHTATVKGKQRWAIGLVEEADGDTYTTVLPWDSSRRRTS